MTFLRTWSIVLLALLVGAGPAVLDRCLIQCHDQNPAQAGTPACHEHAAPSDSASIQGVAGCGHDHEAAFADVVTDARAVAARHTAQVTAVVLPTWTDPALTRGVVVESPPRYWQVMHPPSLSQLRI